MDLQLTYGSSRGQLLQYHWCMHCADKYCGSFSSWVSTVKKIRGAGERETETLRLIITLAWDANGKTQLIAF